MAMKKVSILIGNVIGSYGTTISISLKLKGQWSEIVGTQLSEVTSFCEARYVDKNVLSVTINTLSSAVLIARYNAENIVYNVRQLTGVSSVKLHFKHTNSIPKGEEVRINKIETPQAVKKKYKIDAEFKNPLLKEALESLRTEILNAA
jgi:hypothetical protein